MLLSNNTLYQVTKIKFKKKSNNFDIILSTWAISGYLWLFPNISGYLWLFIALYGCLSAYSWLFPTISGYLCLSLVKSCYLWLSQAVPGRSLIVPELSLDYPGIILVLSLDCHLIIPWLSLDYPWIVPGLSLNYPLIIPAFSLYHSRIISSLSWIICPWSIPVLSQDYQ